MRTTRKVVTCIISVLAAGQFMLHTTALAQRRGLGAGEKIPEFSATDIAGHTFTYKHNAGKVLLIVFLSAGQKHSAQAATDIQEVMSKLGKNIEKLEVVVVVNDPNNVYFQSKEKQPIKNLHIVLDSENKLWGQFGIIATPTLFISDTNDAILWVKAGHGYDFIPTVHAYLNQALGIAMATSPEEAGQVKTVANDTIVASAKRHLQMAKILQQKGKLESAIHEVLKAKEMDPNSVEVTLELGELLCQNNQNKAALNVIEKIETPKQAQLERKLLISGWAKRQMGELNEAEKLLLEATKLNPKPTRALFELGKVYQAKGQIEDAMNAYYKALTIIFNEFEEKSTSH